MTYCEPAWDIFSSRSLISYSRCPVAPTRQRNASPIKHLLWLFLTFFLTLVFRTVFIQIALISHQTDFKSSSKRLLIIKKPNCNSQIYTMTSGMWMFKTLKHCSPHVSSFNFFWTKHDWWKWPNILVIFLKDLNCTNWKTIALRRSCADVREVIPQNINTILH